jgi:hypothetical protein
LRGRHYQATPRDGRWNGPVGSDRWTRDWAALKASRHSQARVGVPARADPPGWHTPAPLGSERRTMSWAGGSYVLFETTEPAPGYRLVGLVIDGVAQVWEMPGYNKLEAEMMSRAFIYDSDYHDR